MGGYIMEKLTIKQLEEKGIFLTLASQALIQKVDNQYDVLTIGNILNGNTSDEFLTVHVTLDGKVVDGFARLNAIRRYMNGEFQYQGKQYRELNDLDKKTINEFIFKVNVI